LGRESWGTWCGYRVGTGAKCRGGGRLSGPGRPVLVERRGGRVVGRGAVRRLRKLAEAVGFSAGFVSGVLRAER